MPTNKKYVYPKEFLTKKGTIKKTHMKKAYAFRKSMKKSNTHKPISAHGRCDMCNRSLRKTKKKISNTHRRKISKGVSRYHKKCSHSINIINKINKTKEEMIKQLNK